jgi:hypothetical protein
MLVFMVSSPRATQKVEDHILSVVRDSLFNIIYPQLLSLSGGRLLHPQSDT